jgi:hypothetical protein
MCLKIASDGLGQQEAEVSGAVKSSAIKRKRLPKDSRENVGDLDTKYGHF